MKELITQDQNKLKKNPEHTFVAKVNQETCRGSHSELLLGKGAMKTYSKYTEEHAEVRFQ